MPFEPGQSGNPGGRPKTEKPWRDALRLAVNRLIGDVEAPFPAKAKVIEVLAHALVKKALTGDVPALKEIADRLDGKPAQAIEHEGEININDERPVSPREAARRLLFAVASAEKQETMH